MLAVATPNRRPSSQAGDEAAAEPGPDGQGVAEEGVASGEPEPDSETAAKPDRSAAAAAAAAKGGSEFLGRTDVAVAFDGSITFRMALDDESAEQLASDILSRLQQ